MVFEHRDAKRDRVFAGLLGEHVDHVLRCMRRVRRADGSPPQNRHARLLGMKVDLKVWDCVGKVRGAFDRRRVDTVLHHFLFEGRSSEDRLTNNPVPPSDDVALLVEARFDAVDVDRAIISAFDVILASPENFDRDWLAMGFRDLAGLTHVVGIAIARRPTSRPPRPCEVGHSQA